MTNEIKNESSSLKNCMNSSFPNKKLKTTPFHLFNDNNNDKNTNSKIIISPINAKINANQKKFPLNKEKSIKKLSFINIISNNIKKYNSTPEIKNKMIINDILESKETHYTSLFKDCLLYDYVEEFFNCYYESSKIYKLLPKLFVYYKNYSKFFCKGKFSDFPINDIVQKYGENQAEIYYKNNYGQKDSHIHNINKSIKKIFTDSIKNSINMYQNLNPNEQLSEISNILLNKEEKSIDLPDDTKIFCDEKITTEDSSISKIVNLINNKKIQRKKINNNVNIVYKKDNNNTNGRGNNVKTISLINQYKHFNENTLSKKNIGLSKKNLMILSKNKNNKFSFNNNLFKTIIKKSKEKNIKSFYVKNNKKSNENKHSINSSLMNVFSYINKNSFHKKSNTMVNKINNYTQRNNNNKSLSTSKNLKSKHILNIKSNKKHDPNIHNKLYFFSLFNSNINNYHININNNITLSQKKLNKKSKSKAKSRNISKDIFKTKTETKFNNNQKNLRSYSQLYKNLTNMSTNKYSFFKKYEDLNEIFNKDTSLKNIQVCAQNKNIKKRIRSANSFTNSTGTIRKNKEYTNAINSFFKSFMSKSKGKNTNLYKNPKKVIFDYKRKK